MILQYIEVNQTNSFTELYNRSLRKNENRWKTLRKEFIIILDFPNLVAPLQKYIIINQWELNIKETAQFILHSAGSELQWAA